MSKRCPDCGFINEDSRIFCSSCGELLDANLRLIKDLESQTSGPKKPTYKEPPARRDPIPPKNIYDENYVPPKFSRQKKSSPLPWIILGVIVIAVLTAILILN